MRGDGNVTGRCRLGDQPAGGAQCQPENDQPQRVGQRQSEAKRPYREIDDHEMAAAEARNDVAGPRRQRRAQEVDDEDDAERGGRQVVRRRGQAKADESEGGEKVEQHAEADRVGRDQLRVFEMPHHLLQRGAESVGAYELLFARQQERYRGSAGERHRREHHHPAAPADDVGEYPGDETASKAAEARA